jgi:hypothetical protein
MIKTVCLHFRKQHPTSIYLEQESVEPRVVAAGRRGLVSCTFTMVYTIPVVAPVSVASQLVASRVMRRPCLPFRARRRYSRWFRRWFAAQKAMLIGLACVVSDTVSQYGDVQNNVSAKRRAVWLSLLSKCCNSFRWLSSKSFKVLRPILTRARAKMITRKWKRRI